MAVKYYKDGQWVTFPGTIGPVGKTGKDAYQLAVEGGYTGTKEEFMANLADLGNLRADLDEVSASNNNNHDLIFTVKDDIYSDIVDNCTSDDMDKMLSARQGKVLKDLIDSLNPLKIKIVTVGELPEVGDTQTFYLKKELKDNSLDTFDEYLYINDGWELVGTTKVDLSNYYTKEEIDNLLIALEQKIKNEL